MKKLSIILASIMLSVGTTAGAIYIEGQDPIVQGDIMLLSTDAPTITPTDAAEEEEVGEVPAADLQKAVAQGTVKAVSDTQIELDDITLNISDYTYIGDYNLNPVEAVKEGDEVYAIVSNAQTLSLPPQAYAYYVLVKTEDAEIAPFYAVVDSVDEKSILTADNQYSLSYENTSIEMFKTKNIVEAKDLTKGSEIVFYADAMTRSIPAYANPSQIKVLRIAEEAEEVKVSPAEFLQTAGVLKGTDKGLELDREVTRAEAVTFLSRIAPEDQMQTKMLATFEDVSKDHWAYETITWALNADLIEGVGEGKFNPDATVTGKQFVKMVLSMVGAEDVTIDKAYELGVAAGIVSDDVAEKISNDKDLTRADVTVLIYNALQAE